MLGKIKPTSYDVQIMKWMKKRWDCSYGFIARATGLSVSYVKMLVNDHYKPIIKKESGASDSN